MKAYNKISICLLFALSFTGACKDKFVSGVIVPASGYLVIQGFINAGTGPTDISLTRTTSLDSVVVVNERGAEVEIISGNGTKFPLTEIQPGQYSLTQLPVDPTQNYHVHVKTADGKEYVSDTSTVKITKPIDNVTFTTSKQNVQIFVSTHDDQNQSQYYQWTFEETWQYNAVFYHIYDYDYSTLTFIRIPAAEDTLPNKCWMTDESNTILIATTAQLSKDIVNQFPVTQISYTESNRLYIRYSILVKQMTLTSDWYEWIQKIKRNTESLGSIFDAQPSQTGGNFHCITEPGEPVIGWVACSTQEEKRIFISRDDLPPVPLTSGYEGCYLTPVLNNPDSIRRAYGLIDDVLYDSSGYGIYGFFAHLDCIDCRAHGGVSTKPSFW